MVRFMVLLLTTVCVVFFVSSRSDIFDGAAIMTAGVAAFCLLVGLFTQLLREN